MIVNDNYKFCFFAIPRTGSQAISRSLMKQKGSVKFLRMHAGYAEFARSCEPAQMIYTKVATTRNPMDSVVSAFFKKKHDHNGRFSRGTYKNGTAISEKALAQYRFIRDTNCDFPEYFKKFFTSPYRRPNLESTIDNCDIVFKFESIAEDYANFVEQMGMAPIPLTVINKTAGRDQNFLSYYTEDIRAQAVHIFKDIFKKWGYAFPEDWHDVF